MVNNTGNLTSITACWRARQRGVTLLELMIVLVIVGILASVAFPAYRDYVDRAKRAEGKTLLSEIQARQERYYFDNNSYTTDATGLGYKDAKPLSSEGNYSLESIAVGDTGKIATSYRLTINPKVSNKTCNRLMLDSKGVRDSETHNPVCWSK